MSTDTPLTEKKRPLSSGSTPSPTVKRSNKCVKMEDLPPELKKSMSSQNNDTDVMEVYLPKIPVKQSDDERWKQVISHVNTLNEEIRKLRAENGDLKASIATANGKIVYLENRMEKAKSDICELEWRMMQKDIVIYNLPESQEISDNRIINEFLIKDLHIKDEMIRSPKNIGGDIEIDINFRIGKKVNGKSRPLVVTFGKQS